MLRIWVVVVLLFLFVPIATDRPLRVQQLEHPELADPPGSRTKWFTVAWNDPQVRAALCCR